MQDSQQSQRRYHLKVEIHFKSGTATEVLASEFDLDTSTMVVKAGLPHKFNYKGLSGDDHSLILFPDEVAGIMVSEHFGYRY
jgi:hypothetical protein